jgi:hypothetical protein
MANSILFVIILLCYIGCGVVLPWWSLLVPAFSFGAIVSGTKYIQLHSSQIPKRIQFWIRLISELNESEIASIGASSWIFVALIRDLSRSSVLYWPSMRISSGLGLGHSIWLYMLLAVISGSMSWLSAVLGQALCQIIVMFLRSFSYSTRFLRLNGSLNSPVEGKEVD